MFQRLEELLGLEEASTLMELLPPVGWADVATTRDLDHLEERLDARIDRLDARFDLFGAELRAELYRSQRSLAVGVIGANAAVMAVLLTAFQLL